MRLVRRPSLWKSFFGRLAFSVVWVGGVVAFWVFTWPRRQGVSLLLYVFPALLSVLALGLVWDVVVRFWRTVTDRQPVLELDRAPLTYGATARLRVLEPHPRSLSEMVVTLAGDHWVTTRERDSRRDVTTHSYERCYEAELLRVSFTGARPVDESVELRLPDEPPADGVEWKIVVRDTLRQGGVMEHWFPVPVSGVTSEGRA